MALVTSAAASLKNTWGFSPQSIPGLQLWLDGADRSSMVFSGTSTTITRWNDKSGNGLHGTATGTPTYTANALNGLGAPALNSNANYFITPTFIISPTAGTPSIFMVMNQTSYSGTGNSDFFLASDWQRIDFLGQGGAFNAAATMNGGAQTPINATTTSNNPTLLSFVVNTASGGVGYANGTFTATSGSSGGRLLSTDTYYIGGGPGFIGFIYELIVFNNTVSTPQRQQVEGYLAAKWGLKANLPATHPYSTGSIIPFNRPFYPTDIPGCSLWLDAADAGSMTFSPGTSNVTQWNDKSGNGYNASNSTYAAPTYSATGFNTKYPGLLFNGYSTMLVTPSILPTPVLSANGTDTTIFVVFNYTGRPVSGGFVLYGLGSQANLYVVRTPWNTGGDAGGAIIDTAGSNTRIIAQFGSANPAQLYSIFRSGASHYFYQFGSLTASNLSSTGTVGTTSQPLNIGGGLADGQWFNSYISEFIIFNTALTTAQRQQVEQYLAWKWGLPTANLPTGHPGKLLPAFSTPFTPKSVTGLTWWVDGMDTSTMTFSSLSNISSWADKSGNGYNATGVNSPQKISTGGVSFVASSSNYFTMGVTYSRTQTMFMVASPVPSTSANQYYINTYIGNHGGIFLGGYNSSYISYYNSAITNFASGTTTNPFVVSVVKVQGGTSVGNYNGSQAFSVADNSVDSDTTTWAVLGGAASNAGLLTANIYEFVIFNVALTSNQIQQVEGYLAWKWGLQRSLPSTHAYAKIAP